MDYEKRQAKKRRETILTTVFVLGCILAYVGYAYVSRMAVRWDIPDFQISDFRDKDANIVGRTYEVEHQQALFEALQLAVDEAYMATAGGKKRAPHRLVAVFSETFSQDLVVTINTDPKSPHQWQRQFKRDEVDAGVVVFGQEVGEAFARTVK